MDENVITGVEQALSAARPLDEEINRALEGALFPLERSDVVAIARENAAATQLVTLLSSTPDRTFRSVREVQDAVSPS